MNERTLILVGLGSVLALGLVGFLAARRAGLVPGPNTFNPLSRENVAYTGVNDLGAAISGDKDWNLGARTWEWIHGWREPDLTAPVVVRPPSSAVVIEYIAPDSQIAPYYAP